MIYNFLQDYLSIIIFLFIALFLSIGFILANFLFSPSNPDPDADIGEHSFTYSLLPHKQDLIRSSVIAESAFLNQEPVIFEGVSSNLEMPIKLSGKGSSPT